MGAGLRLLRGRKYQVSQRDVPFAVILLVLPANKPEADMSQKELGSLSLNCWTPKPPKRVYWELITAKNDPLSLSSPIRKHME